jgi:hypothetical protein
LTRSVHTLAILNSSVAIASLSDPCILADNSSFGEEFVETADPAFVLNDTEFIPGASGAMIPGLPLDVDASFVKRSDILFKWARLGRMM